jgi:hypothetical protein
MKNPEAVLDRALSFLGQDIALKMPAAGSTQQQQGETKLPTKWVSYGPSSSCWISWIVNLVLLWTAHCVSCWSQAKSKQGGDNKGNLVIARSKEDLNQAFLAKKSSGWSLPLKDADALTKYAHTLEWLYKFYAHPNEELYRMMEALGPASGWTGKFPTKLAEGKSFPTTAPQWAMIWWW